MFYIFALFNTSIKKHILFAIANVLMTYDNLCFQEQQRKGVIVATDCNFSMAVAHHAVELKIPVFVIMPSCCSSTRLRTYRDYGAMVISYGGTGHDSQNHARHLARENGYLYVEESVPLTLDFYLVHKDYTKSLLILINATNCCTS